MVGSYVSVIVFPLMVPVATVAPVGNGAGGAGVEDEEVRGLGGEEDELEPERPGAGSTGAAVGQWLTEGCVVYAAHPIVFVAENVWGRSGTGVPSQSISTINNAVHPLRVVTYCSSYICKLRLAPDCLQ